MVVDEDLISPKYKSFRPFVVFFVVLQINAI